MRNDLQTEINEIKSRNKRVEGDKAWETSWVRIILVAILTYLVVCLFLYIIKAEQPFVTAIIPTIGFVLSTASLSFAKKIWLKYRSKN
ncbi:MAG: hypothetical protein WC752_02595 [Patescibacteria group bacterium]